MNEDWREKALCIGKDTNLFFPESGIRAAIKQARMMKSVCYACPVRLECLNYAVAKGEEFGIWGGFSAKERRKLKKVNGFITVEQASKMVKSDGD